MKNVRLKVLAILTLILLTLIVVAQKYQIFVSYNQAGLAVHVSSKQQDSAVITKTPKKLNLKKPSVITVKINGLKVQEQPSLVSPIVGILNSGTKMTVIHEKSGWLQIQTPGGIEGWVSTIDMTGNKDTQPVSAAASVESASKPLKGKTIVLDPGHGGNDKGTTSIDGTYEKILTLSTAEAVKQKLMDAGANVILTRTTDTYIPLSQRANISNQNHADAFISFHYNCFNDPTMNGLTDFYYQKSRDGALAKSILNEVVNTTGLNDVGTRFDNLEVLRNNTQPSTLIELGFLSSTHDESIVESSSYPDQVALGVYLGLLDYFSSKK